MLFDYIAKNNDGQELKGTLEAQDKQAAMTELEKKDLWILSLDESGGSWKLDSEVRIFSWIPARLFNAFLIQLSVMIKSGVSLLEALASLEQGEENVTLKRIVGGVKRDIEKGNSFSDALANYPEHFSPFFINMIRIGETGGVLEEVLVKLASVNQRSVALRNQLFSALTYPALLILVTSGVLGILFGFALPRFAVMFKSANFPLPLPTKIVLGVGDIFKEYYVVFLILLAVGFLLAFLGVVTRTGRWIAGEIALKIPVVRAVVRNYLIVHISESLGLLLGAGVPLLELLGAVESTLTMPTARNTLASMRTFIERGTTMRLALEGNPIFPPMALKLIETGEQTGNLDKMFNEIASYYDDVLQSSIKATLSIIEPLIIFFMAGIVGFIMLAVILPIFQMSQAFRGR